MATNLYFSQKVRSEQQLYEDIVIESLKTYGQDVFYLPRDIVFEDRIFFSSSMDFANEYGFETHDGAKEIFYSAQNMIQDEIVANGQFACDFDG